MPDRPPRSAPGWLVRVDTGGTFTDGWALDPGGGEQRCKVLSSGVMRARIDEVRADGGLKLGASLGATESVWRGFGLRGGGTVARWDEAERVLVVEDGADHRAGEIVELGTGEEAPVVAARLLTGTAPGEAFPPMEFRVATTRGTNALLERKGEPGVLFVTEGFEDLLAIRDQRRPELFALAQDPPPPVFARTIGVRERIAADGTILEPLEVDALRRQIAEVRAEGFRVAAVALLNSYANPVHEARVGELLESAGFAFVTRSVDLSERIRLLPRAETAAANSYLGPVMRSFVEAVRTRAGGEALTLMTSAGFLEDAAKFRPVDSLLSGPAGGAVGALAAAEAAGYRRIIAFDMGGTSTDVARLEGRPSFRYEQAIGPVRVVAPAIRIETVAAGGGSICTWRNGGLEVGPESAGAEPGPACYGRGGPLTITDVNLLLGCMEAGKTGIPLDEAAARERLEDLQAAMVADGADPGREEALLEGLREIAVERMAEAIRKVSLREGYDPSEYVLVAFGGAGPQHGCAVARKLGVREILVPGDAGLLSAWGLHRAAREAIAERQVLMPEAEAAASWRALLEKLEAQARESLGGEGTVARLLVELRLLGQDSALEVEMATPVEWAEVVAAFRARYEALYGYEIPEGRSIELVALRVVAAEAGTEQGREEFAPAGPAAESREVRQDSFRTCVVEPRWDCAEGSRGSLRLTARERARGSEGHAVQGVEAELFRCRFESVVEEMGELLRRTAVSTNVKERLDFSCALLDAEGRLVVNAPHIPVHLGALGLCVREVSAGRTWRAGDMVVVNHPGFGGSHLPDVTVVSPVVVDGAVTCFVANRAHHAELGGRAPGSMPAVATTLEEEGVVIPPTLLFDAGESRLEAVMDLFTSARFPSRNVDDNRADLAAQAAANRHGVGALRRLLTQAGPDRVASNMARLRHRAAEVMRTRFATLGEGAWEARDAMDDGAAIAVRLELARGRLRIDFAGSGGVHPGNLNAVPAIVRSAVLYVLRLWSGENVPLNEGLLDDVDLVIPRGMLNPEFDDDPGRCPAVVGGNVETSQRIVDVLLEALGLQANGQGTMNNLLFGTGSFGYYETIGGGSGAGPGWDGMSGTHVHMSNTSITDPEIVERRYPVRVRAFTLRRGSGGAGRWRGGDGLVREIEFLAPVTVSLLTQRRALAPRGGAGGGPGFPGKQVVIRPEGREEILPPVTSFEVNAGDRVRIETPGGGGWGAKP